MTTRRDFLKSSGMLVVSVSALIARRRRERAASAAGRRARIPIPISGSSTPGS